MNGADVTYRYNARNSYIIWPIFV